MNRCVLPYNTKAEWLELRAQDITSTDCAALFGISPYKGEFEVWHEKRGQTSMEFTENERMKWGNRLEDAIARGIAEDNDWAVQPFKDYMRVEGLKLGSSFDYVIGQYIDGEFIAEGILEIKNVDGIQFNNTWEVEDGEVVEAPPHIELQVQHQLLVSGLKYAYIGALVGGNSVKLIKREPDEAVISAIKDRVQTFWKSVESGEVPQANFEADAAFISRLHGFAEPGKILEADEQITVLAEKYRDVSAQEKEFKQWKESIKAELLTIIKDAEKVKGERFSITAGMVGPAEVSFTRKAYRNFRVNWRKK